MSYVIEPMPLIPFLEDTKLRLPRFQRKASWKKQQYFELVISVFQDYPVGVVIVNREKKVSWLLDGRQRRTALQIARNNPVELYEWAQSYVGFKKRADELEVRNAYWEKVSRYLQTEEVEENNEAANENDVEEANEDTSVVDFEEDSFDHTLQRDGLNTLLDLILMVHQKTPSGSRWEKVFDFRKYITKLKYAPARNNNKIDPVLLRKFILELLQHFDSNYDGERTQEAFVEYYLDNCIVQDETAFKKAVAQNWSTISTSMDTIDRAEKIFGKARIGLITLTNATPLDAQNIFSRINQGGTKLKAEELLSAKPFWNKPAPYLNVEICREMYSCMGLPTPETAVRWDVAATFVSRVKGHHLLFDSYKDETVKDDKRGTALLSEISLGFKLLSSVYTEGMSAKHVNELEQKESIRWETDIDELIVEINTVCAILLADNFFKCYNSWRKSMSSLLGNAITLEFITILWLDWKDRGRPCALSAETHALQRDARILFDKLVFEYATRTWRGSGDSKMSKDIKNWKGRLLAIDSSSWNSFITDACKGSYKGQDTSVSLLRPILYYYYILREQIPLAQNNVSFDVDHIVPQESFKDNSLVDVRCKDCLANLSILPSRDNTAKKAKRLNEITDPWLKQTITMYSGINAADFDRYSDIAHFGELQEMRSKLFLDVFGAKRDSALIN